LLPLLTAAALGPGAWRGPGAGCCRSAHYCPVPHSPGAPGMARGGWRRYSG